MQTWHFVSFAIILTWILIGCFHYHLIPPLDKSDEAIRRITGFIANFKNIKMNSGAPLPVVNVIMPESPSPDMSWDEWIFVADYIAVGYYDPDSNRVMLLEGCRQNILVHELVHYVQAGGGDSRIAKEKMDDKEAWKITRLYFKFFHPYRYKFLMAMTFGGLFDWWTSMPY